MGASLAAACSGERLWCSERRSPATRARAEAVGLVDVGSVDALVHRAEVIVSVCPPASADGVAGSVAALGYDGIYVDVNAVGHTDRLERLLSIVKEGGYLEVDTFGQEFYTPWADLTSFLRYFCDAGFTNRLLISIDCNWRWENGKRLFEGAEPPARDPNASKRTYAYMMTDAVPKLMRSEFSEREIHTFLADNPRSFFCGV